MGPKKDKKKAEDDQQTKPGATFTEVEKTFLELQIADCNRKIARLRTAVDEYERRNEELQKQYDKLDEDRADIISYLKKTLNLKNEENVELKDKVKGLEEAREIETAQFKEKVAELERNFTIMKDQLTSENKLLAGKLNTLEEFRAIRDDLMRKYEKQEQDFKDQEMKYKRIIYDAEKKFVIGKDKLKKEMEARLLQLAQDFQDATELRIAASTHRVIRENIAINNELDSILSTQSKLADQNEVYKEKERAARVAMELAEEERDKAINKNVIQLKVIDQLTNAFQEIKKEKAIYEKKSFDFDNLQTKIEKLTKENENLSLQVRILEQNLHAKLNDQTKSLAESTKIISECDKLKKILKEAAISVQAALKLDQWAVDDPTREIMDRQILLSRLLDIISQYRDLQHSESKDTLGSLGQIYKEGDLGFIPKKRSLHAVAATPSKETMEIAERASSSDVLSESSLGSVKTIPSLQLLPAVSQPILEDKESAQSFVTSTKSTVSDESTVTEEEEVTDIERALAASKAEIQKAIAADLKYSQMALKSQMKFSDERSKMNLSKSVIIEGVEDEENDEKEVKIEGETEPADVEEAEKVVEDEEKAE